MPTPGEHKKCERCGVGETVECLQGDFWYKLTGSYFDVLGWVDVPLEPHIGTQNYVMALCSPCHARVCSKRNKNLSHGIYCCLRKKYVVRWSEARR